MATQAIAAQVSFGAVETLREFNLVKEIKTAFSTWYSKHQTRKTLLSLSEEQLEDIGLCRADVL
ncbi:MAG: DUF1127 domain-containing protein [Cognatishimia sp.]|uniref:DUF1127 domain-containing protein n=1 Tax=Cognatishimia sp. 1_MG-2023 TaxID=3062642 RepID=UPI0026E2A7EC|nr:DUF1127 domain-containing protein [Cognatishimia sp. 1_MG-2023]MDO6727110.1 DUF1127 domain-containing protein [Cognatishimia sp. 1_MG-2023]